MKQLANCLSLVLLGSVAIAAGCSSSATHAQRRRRHRRAPAAAAARNLQALLPDPTGYVDVGATGTTGDQGRVVRLRRRHRLGWDHRDR